MTMAEMPGRYSNEDGESWRLDDSFARSHSSEELAIAPVKVARVVGIAFILLFAAACGGGTPSGPSSDAIVTFAVANESFRVWLTSAEQIEGARAAQIGGRARIPIGRIVPGTQVNTGWNWHLEDVEFAESTIELCDGLPSDVEREKTGFGGGRFCPWTAKVIRIEEREK